MCWVCKLYGIPNFTDVAGNEAAFDALVDAVAERRGVDEVDATIALCNASLLPQSEARH